MAFKRKTILILGNGFDLAHGLPTKYSHFLEFCTKIKEITRSLFNGDWDVVAACKKGWHFGTNEKTVGKEFITVFVQNPNERNVRSKCYVLLDNASMLQIKDLIDDNVWYEYFVELQKSNHMKGENWIDFESEIRFIIKEVDENTSSLADFWSDVIQSAKTPLNEQKLEMFHEKLKFDKYLKKKEWSRGHINTLKDFREKAFEDLERLTRALEIYLSAFVEKIQTNIRISVIDCLTPDYVINFNYTNTYERIYGKGKVYHIHGKADMNHSIEDNNMVLGIDEYWLGDKQNEKTDFTIFKKFAQRIQKHTGNDSYKYMREIQKQFMEKKDTWSGAVDMTKTHSDGVTDVYVFGHSLDITDKDILSSFIGDDATSVIVYCMDKGTEGELIANTIKLITEKRLLEKANHVPPKLKYVIPSKEK